MYIQKQKKLITRMQQRKGRKIESTLDYFLSTEEIEEIETIESDISDHKPIVVNVRIKDSSLRKQKQYIYTRENIINNENINKLLETNWPNENNRQIQWLFQKKSVIRPVIKLQDKAKPILNENINWELKILKLNDLRKREFWNTIKSLNTYTKTDISRFYKILNTVFKFKQRGKLQKE